MITGTTTATTISVLLPTLKASALASFTDVGPTRQLIANYAMPNGQLVLPNYGTLSVAALTEGVPIGTTQQMALTSGTLTAVKYGAKVFLSDEAVDRALKGGNEDLVAEAGRELGMAIGTQVDTLLVGLFDGFSNATGSAGTELTVAEFGKAIAKLRKQMAPQPYACVLHPYQAYNLMADLKVPSTSAARNLEQITARDFFEGYVLGVPVYTSANITVDGLDDAKGGMFNRDAIAFGVEKDITVEAEREIGTGWNIAATMRFAYVERKDDYGVKMLYDAAL